MILLTLLQSTPTWLTGFNVLLALLGAVILVGGALVVLLVRKNDTVNLVQSETIKANEGLVKVKQELLDDCKAKCSKCQEELDEVTAELRTQMALDIDKLMGYWQIRDSELADKERIEAKNRQLRIRLGDQADI